MFKFIVEYALQAPQKDYFVALLIEGSVNMYTVKVTCYSYGGCSVNKYSFVSPSDALNFALNVHAEMTEKHQAGLLEYCAVAFICPEIGERGWED